METVERNLRGLFEWLASRRAEGEVREEAGLRIASAGASFQMFNAAFLAPGAALGAAELERRIASARVHFGARGLAWSFWVCDHLLDAKARRRARSLFESQSLPPASELPAMAAEGLAAPSRDLPGIEVRRVGDEATRLAFCDVGCVCFHVPANWFREIFLPESVWDGPAEGYVGYLDGEPVSTALTFTAGGVTGIYNVATLPGRRRKGYGEFMMRTALGRARDIHGAGPTILQSTGQGYAMYTRMGYRTVGRVEVFASR